MAARRDIIVIGASLGGVEALSQLVATLPPDLPAAVFVVLHVPEAPQSRLPDLLNRCGTLRATHAVHGEKIEPGRIYVAPTDNHLTLSNGQVRVFRGPKENGHRPAVDPLFRTAAASYGKRVIGVVLTGARDCGTAGLLAIHARGGLAIVQRPEEAACPSMPASALAAVPSARSLPLAEIARALVRLAGEPIAETPTAKDAGMAAQHQNPPYGLTCPSCHGAMLETEENGFPGYRCHVGHAYTLRGMVSDQAEDLESALWAAVRALKECVGLSS